jgi:hypothetical protein
MYSIATVSLIVHGCLSSSTFTLYYYSLKPQGPLQGTLGRQDTFSHHPKSQRLSDPQYGGTTSKETEQEGS